MQTHLFFPHLSVLVIYEPIVRVPYSLIFVTNGLCSASVQRVVCKNDGDSTAAFAENTDYKNDKLAPNQVPRHFY